MSHGYCGIGLVDEEGTFPAASGIVCADRAHVKGLGGIRYDYVNITITRDK
jgi:hypothetical protein